MQSNRTRPMEPASAGIERVLIDSMRRAPNGEAPLLAWPLVCGNAVARRTRAAAFTQGVLRIEVPDAGWRAELQALAGKYLAALNRYSRQAVKRIEFVTAEEVESRADPVAVRPAFSKHA
ncbi:MAG: DUF721 domain-containing protein [Acidobacteriales bacterium]|nr:DUF721 domain-containing protein [Terriglobales bacterium]